MSWVKRNLYFLIGSFVALVMMGAAGWFLYSKWQLNNEMLDKLNGQYEELRRLGSQSPHPGSGDVDNINAAKDQQQHFRDFVKKARKYFQPIPPIPDSPKVTGQEFSAALGQTIDQLQRDATNASVALPPDFGFTFSAQRHALTFAPGSLQPLSLQLGEVKTICGVLFAAKVNALDLLRRERISDDDARGPQTDYLEKKSVTNELAVLSPYELTFRCFSSELAAILAGFASSPNALLVKTINVELAPATTVETITTPTFAVMPVVPPTVPAQTDPEAFRRRYGLGPQSEQDAFARRYGLGPTGRPLTPPPVVTPPPAAAPATTSPSTSRGGLPTVLDERQLKVTLTLNVVKLAAPK